jgi:hypothetical protein
MTLRNPPTSQRLVGVLALVGRFVGRLRRRVSEAREIAAAEALLMLRNTYTSGLSFFGLALVGRFVRKLRRRVSEARNIANAEAVVDAVFLED